MQPEKTIEVARGGRLAKTHNRKLVRLFEKQRFYTLTGRGLGGLDRVCVWGGGERERVRRLHKVDGSWGCKIEDEG